VLHLGNGSVEFGFWMTRGDDPRPLCRARVRTATVDMATMQKCPVPTHWRERFQPFLLREEDFPRGR
jgi:acyl-CoA thioesterase FadM